MNNLSWTGLIEYIANLKSENERLKNEKQQLVSRIINLELQVKQEHRRRERTYKVLISEIDE